MAEPPTQNQSGPMLGRGLGLLQDFFDLADFLLDFAGYFFSGAFILEVGVVGGVADLFLYLPFYLVECALCLILVALAHLSSPSWPSIALERERTT